MKEKAFLSAGEAARALGVSVKTIRRWDKAGLLPVMRTATNQRRIAAATLHQLLQARGRSLRCAIYARVGSAKQDLMGHLTRQVERLQQVARERGYQVVALIAEQTSSLNEQRTGLKRLLTLIDQQEIDVVLTEELVADLLSMVTVVAGRLDGSRAKRVRSCVANALKDCLKAEEADGTDRENDQTPA